MTPPSKTTTKPPANTHNASRLAVMAAADNQVMQAALLVSAVSAVRARIEAAPEAALISIYGALAAVDIALINATNIANYAKDKAAK